MSHLEVVFPSDGVRCSAWHFPAHSQRLTGPAGRPVVVLAHGFGGTKDSGLAPFAERFAAAGADAFAFDYRGFGASEGTPRQTISITRAGTGLRRRDRRREAAARCRPLRSGAVGVVDVG